MMMENFVERDDVFDFSGCVDAFKADEHSYNGLSLVDFVVETSDKYLFIEVKNADSDKAKMHSEREEFVSSPSVFAQSNHGLGFATHFL